MNNNLSGEKNGCLLKMILYGKQKIAGKILKDKQRWLS